MDIFANLTAGQRNFLYSAFSIFLCDANTTIYRKYDPADCIYIVKKGVITLSPENGKTRQKVLGEGDIFGESLFTPRKHFR
jgi:signal-transduction protein with cAMP-binding, CBS, and nucleotidyltransferase domain